MPPMDERAACAQLKRRFEAAGFRIKENQTFDEDGIRFDIDGFDPSRRVGYEYVTDEAGDGWDVDGDVIAALAERRQRGELHVLVVDEDDAPDAASLDHAIDEFLKTVPPTTAPTPPEAAGAPARPARAATAPASAEPPAHEPAAAAATPAPHRAEPAEPADSDDDIEPLDAPEMIGSPQPEAARPPPPPTARPKSAGPTRPPPTPKGAKKKPARKSK